MPRITFTDTALRALMPPPKSQVTYWDQSVPSFGLRVSPGGTKTFIVMHGANRSRTTIGRFPTLSLKQARDEAKRLQASLTLGMHNKTKSISYDEARDRFLEASARKNRPRTVYDYRRHLTKHFPFGRTKIDEIERADVNRRLSKLKDTPAEQNYAFVSIRTFFNWAVREELIERSPIVNMRMPNRINTRERMLNDEELGIVYAAAARFHWPFGPIVQLTILTGQRRSEIASLEWDWIDQDARTITIPGFVAKNRRTHTFPYGDTIASILEDLPRFKVDADANNPEAAETKPYLFPSRNKNGTVFNGWAKAKLDFDATFDGVAPYTLHDLRRTFSSMMAMLGTPIHVTEKLLNHVSGTISGVAAVYNRHSYMDEMREAIDTYERHIARLQSK